MFTVTLSLSGMFISNALCSASGVRLASVPLHQVEQSTHDARDHRRRAHARDDISKRMSATLHVRHAAAKLGFSAAHQTQVRSFDCDSSNDTHFVFSCIVITILYILSP